MYKNIIQRLITQSPLEIDTEIQMTGRPPTMANSEFLTNKQQGDWAEQVVYKAINEFSDEYFAVKYGRSDMEGMKPRGTFGTDKVKLVTLCTK